MSLGWPLTALAALAALAYWLGWCWQGPSAAKSALKTTATAALAAAALAFGAPILIVVGLALGALGDLALSRPGDRAFLLGMGAFALGHLAYSGAFAASATAWPAVAPTLAVLALGASTEAWLAPRTGALRWPVRGYVAVICAMALAALTLPAPAWPVILGAGLFLFSDLLLSVEIFVLPASDNRRLLPRAVWAAYWGGQALIALGASGALGPSL